MKILVLSDTHSNLKNARNVLQKIGDRIHMVIHLGDMVTDAETLQQEFSGLPFHIVRGNNDYDDNALWAKKISILGHPLLLTHGHKQHVHWNYDNLYYWAEENQAEIALFGHTHGTVNDGNGQIMLFNPGSISLPRDSHIPTFGILDIEKNSCINASIMEFHGNNDFRIRSTAKSTPFS